MAEGGAGCQALSDQKNMHLAYGRMLNIKLRSSKAANMVDLESALAGEVIEEFEEKLRTKSEAIPEAITRDRLKCGDKGT